MPISGDDDSGGGAKRQVPCPIICSPSPLLVHLRLYINKLSAKT